MQRRGFTLVELMIVIGIIAIIMALMIPNYIRTRSNAMVSACESNVKNISVGVEMYGVDNQGHFPATFPELTPSYLKVIPTCPAVGTDTYTPAYSAVIAPDQFTFYCSGNNHFTSNFPANYPQYFSGQGLITPF